MCQAIRATQGKGSCCDGSSRFRRGKEPLFHYMGCSTFANHSVLPEIALAKTSEDAPFDKVCYIGCGVTTGIKAVVNTLSSCSNVVVFGLGGIGLNVIQGARMVGANKIIGVDVNPARRDRRGLRDDALREPAWREVGAELVPHLIGLDWRRRRLQLRVRRQRGIDAPGSSSVATRVVACP